MIVEVTAPLGGVFHPKLWLLRFTGDNVPPIVRLVILSRNVTGDRCWDVSLVMDGEVVDRKRGFGAHSQFAEFIQALPRLAVHSPDPSVIERANRLAEDARRADFKCSEEFSTYEIIPLGLKPTRKPLFPAKVSKMLVVSPFLTKGFLDKMPKGAQGHILISRLDELAKLPAEALAPFERVYTLSDAALGPNPSDDVDENSTSSLTGLHAKLYVIDEGKGSTICVGSANATGAAFTRNVEILVALTGKKSQIGVDVILSPVEGQASLLDMLTSYSPPDTPVLPDPVEEELEKRLDEFRLTIATAGLHATVEGNAGQFTLRLVGAESVPLPEGVSASLWPITVPEQANAQPLTSGGKPLSFGPYPLAAVTAFFAVAARATAQGRSLEARFVLPLPLDNAPSGRREAILGALLDDPEKFLRFLEFLLGDLDELGPMPTALDKQDGASFGSWESGGFVLFESLLRALKDDPKRLDYVSSAVAELMTSENGRDRLPPGFLPIWEAIWAARRELVA